MNKSIKYLGFAFLGSLLFFTLGALRPFIASLNGLGVSTTLSNSVMVGTLRSMSGAVTNVDMPNSAPQHINFLPQTANTGEFDIGDPSQSTGRYLMFSKPAGAFVIGHDGTDALRLNVANGFITLPGGGLLGDIAGETFTLNTNATFQVSGLAQLLVAGDDIGTHRAEIFLHGTNAHIRLDAGAAIEDATAVTHLTMAAGSGSIDGTFNINGSGTSPNIAMVATSLFGVYIKVAPTNNNNITNIMGINHVAFSSVLTFDAGQASRFTVTNRVTSAATLVITNTVGRLELDAFVLGEASGGTDRIITIVPDLGHLIFNEDNYGTALATSYAFTLTNGNAVEIQDARRMLNGTNIHAIVTRQGKF